MISIGKIFWFSAGHYLPYHEGACKNQHGHNYKLEVEVSAKINKETGMVMDFGKIDEIVDLYVIRILDHTQLNDHFSNPTAETMLEQIARTLYVKMPQPIQVTRLRLWETEKCYAEWRPGK